MIKKIFQNLNKTVFFICLFVSITLIISSFIVPPTGVIHSSVIAAVGEIFAFAALGTVLHAIEKGFGTKLTKGDVSIELSKEDEDE